MAAFAVVRLNPPGFAHAGIFAEPAEMLCHGLRELGHDCVLSENTFFADRINVILAPHLLRHFDNAMLPPAAVLFNLEPIIPEMLDRLPGYLELLRQPAITRVWDYDPGNVERLAAAGIGNAEHVELGYAEPMTRIDSLPRPDIDVLFYGSPAPRRLAVRDALAEAGLSVHFAFGVYGKERDALIARARVVLNVSQFARDGAFDIVRLSYLLSNGRCVVCESGIDARREREFDAAVSFAAYDDLVAECRYFCRMDQQRMQQERAGLAFFKGRRQAGFLREAVSRLLNGAPD